MARHVFQYDKMDSELGLFLGDPSSLPPLRPTLEQQQQQQQGGGGGGSSGAFERPQIADEAGLIDRNVSMNTGAAHRQQALERRQREELMRDAATPTTASLATQSPLNNNRNNDAPIMAEAVVIRD